jgi:PAS domain S-box-containing protein
MLEGTPNPIYIKDGDGRIILANKATMEAVGKPAAAIIGKTDIEVFDNPDVGLAMTENDRKVIRSGKTLSLEEFVPTSSGIRTFISVKTPYRNENGEIAGVFGISHDMTAHHRDKNEKEMTIEFLRQVNEAGGLSDLVEKAVAFFQGKSGCSAVGIRLKEGDDYPYFEYRGFSSEFVAAENTLCQRDDEGFVVRDADFNPIIECMCGNVIRGRFDSSKPFFTENGSFWSNCTTELLASTTEADRQARTRNRCNGEGYESVALVPLINGTERLGLLQLNDKRKNMFSIDAIRFWERMAFYLAVALSKFRAERALQESERKYRILFREMLNGFALHEMMLDEKGIPADYRFIDVNPAFERMTGLSRETIVGRTVREIMPGIERAWIERYGSVALTGVPVFFDDFSLGLNKYFEVTAFRPASGQFACIFSDITERKRTEQMLQNTQKLEALGVLAGGIAHDFNNLLGGIFGNIELAAEHSEGKAAGYLAKASGTIDRARGLTQQLLTFAKGGVPVKKTERLASFIQDTARFALSGSNVSCRFSFREPLWLCDIDKNQIGQVIDNIVINAQQSMPEGGTIEIGAENVTFGKAAHALLPAGAYVRISVADHGCGIAAEILPRIFDPFYTTKAMGHGLGLATCYSIVKRHGGCIDVQSEPGKGSTFSFYLPVSSGAGKADSARPAAEQKSAGTFLLMDDEAVIRDTVGEMLTSLGYSVVWALDGREAIRMFSEARMGNGNVDGMIFDLTIPGGLGGKEAIAEIREMDNCVPVFVISGYANDPVMSNPSDYGFTASISKPFRKKELAELLEKYVKVKR